MVMTGRGDPVVLITTSSGQDAFFLSSLLKQKGFFIVGLKHKDSFSYADQFFDLIISESFTNTSQLVKIIKEFKVDYVFNLAAKSSVALSWTQPEMYLETNGLAVKRLLSDLSRMKTPPRFIQIGSTDMVGSKIITSQPATLSPWSPYGLSKEIAHNAVLEFRELGFWAASAILTNHDSYLRPSTFLMRQLSGQIAEVVEGKSYSITVRNVNTTRDWASAGEIVDGIFALSQQEIAQDWVLATGKSYSVGELLSVVKTDFNLDFETVEKRNSDTRPKDVEKVYIDARLAQRALGWDPQEFGPTILKKLVHWDLLR